MTASVIELPEMKRPAKIRLDVLLVERGLADSREKARALILAGRRHRGWTEER